MKNTGDIIKKRREELKLTQVQLADALGCSQPNIRKIEQGSTPDIRIALKIEQVLGLNIKSLFLESESAEIGIQQPTEAYSVNPDIKEVVDLMNSTDERGRLKIKLAAIDAFELHNSHISRARTISYTDEEIALVEKMRSSTPMAKKIINAAVTGAETTESSTFNEKTG